MRGEYTDQELLDRYYREHDSNWLGELFRRYTLLLLGVCMKYLRNEEEARDAVQQVFLKAMTELPKYRVTYFKSWIYMVAKNYCLMLLRNNGNRHVDISTTPLESPDDESAFQAMLEQEKQLSLLESALVELNEDQRTCITLFYLEKKSYQEIVERTGYSFMQVKSHIQNGKRNLRIIMERKMKHQQ
mgnify:CR=1 FL=1